MPPCSNDLPALVSTVLQNSNSAKRSHLCEGPSQIVPMTLDFVWRMLGSQSVLGEGWATRWEQGRVKETDKPIWKRPKDSAGGKKGSAKVVGACGHEKTTQA